MSKYITIKLTKGYETIVDECDADLGELKWYPVNKDGRIYVWRKSNGRRNAKTLYLARVIYERMINRPLLRTELVDHKDNNSLNNRRNNLRLANKANNAHNSKLSSRNTSGYKGIYFDKRRQLWCADIKINNRKKYLGRYATKEEAAKAYANAAKEYHKEFMRLK